MPDFFGDPKLPCRLYLANDLVETMKREAANDNVPRTRDANIALLMLQAIFAANNPQRFG